MHQTKLEAQAIETYRVVYEWDPEANTWEAEIGGLGGARTYGPSLIAARQNARATIAELTGIDPRVIDVAEEIRVPSGTAVDVRPTHSLTRLAVGATLWSWDVLRQQMQLWEAETDRTGHADVPALPEAPAAHNQLDSRALLVGIVFEIEERVARGSAGIATRSRAALGRLDRTLDRIGDLPPLTPLRAYVDELRELLEGRVRELEGLGRREEMRSRSLVETAIATVTQSSVDSVVSNPEVRALVKEQSAGLASEVADQIRGRTVSADTVIERFVRRLLGRKSREDLIAAEVGDPSAPTLDVTSTTSPDPEPNTDDA